MRSARSWSIATRLTVVFTVCLAIIQSGASVYLFWSLKQDILAQAQAALQEHVREVRLVNSGPQGGGPVPPERWEAHVLTRKGVYVRLLDATGRRLSESEGMSVPTDAFPVPAAADAVPGASIAWRDPASGADLMLMSAVAQVASGSPNGVIQAAMDLSDAQEQFVAYERKLFGVWLGVVLSALVIGYAGIRRELAHVRRIALAAGRINADHFDERLADAPMPAELKELAQAFDAMLQRLRNSFEQLSQFSSDVAHEFRTPLNNLVSAATVTLSRTRSAEEYRELIERSMEQYDMLSRTIDGMLFLARIENQQTRLRPERMEAAREFQTVAEFFDPLAEERGVRLVLEGSAQFVADPVLLRRALSNLVANALRHSAPGQSVTLQAQSADGAGATLRVIDTGEGIAPGHLPRLFDRFYQVDPARSDGSTGLGLAIVKTIVNLHGGTVEVASRLGEGTTFTVRLPPLPMRIG